MSRNVFGRPEHRRKIAVGAFTAVMVAAVWSQRTTFTAAFGELRSLPWWIAGMLVIIGVIERLVRIDIFRGLFGGGSTFGTAATVHEVGTAVSKGIPMGGPIAMGMRWSICRDASIPTTAFTVTVIAAGAAATFVTWTLPLLVLGIDLTRREADVTDLAVLIVCSVFVFGSVAFWWVTLGSDRVHRWCERRSRQLCDRAGRRIPAAQHVDTTASVDEVRTGLRAVAVRPWGLLTRMTIAQLCGALVLLIALRGVGVGSELDTIEFLRVFFIVTLLGSFIPTPGGVGVIEAGLSGALVAAGVAPTSALAAVLVYRLITYVMPILFGAVLYLFWRGGAAARAKGHVDHPRWADGTPVLVPAVAET
jgi:putative heme transporter